MLKRIVQSFIRKSKNKDFSFDKQITSSLLFSFIFNKVFSLLRGLKFYNFKKRGKFIFFGKRVILFNRSNMYFGNNVTIGNYVKISALGNEKLEIRNNASIGSFSQIITSTSFNNIGRYIIIGENVGMGEFCYIG